MINFIEITFLIHILGGMLSGFVKSLLSFMFSIMFVNIGMKTHGNYHLVTLISEYIIKNRIIFQGMSCVISKSNYDIQKNQIKGQEMKLAPGMTIFWYNGSLFWAITEICPNSHRFEITNVAINSFRWNTTKMEDFIQEMLNIKDEPILYTYQGGWTRTKKIIKITKDTYISNNKTLEIVESYIETFINAESDYKKQQRPYKTGILLGGPPGVGKSSLIMYLAHRFSRPVYLLFAYDLSKNEDIAEIINEIPSNSFLLFEDFDGIDSLTSERDYENEDSNPRRGNNRKKMSAEGLLKKLQSTFDGFLSPNNGLIYFISTNNVDKIDANLIRDGRIDLRIAFTYATDDWIRSRFIIEFPKATPKQLDHLVQGLNGYDVVQSKFSNIVSTVKPHAEAHIKNSLIVGPTIDDYNKEICDTAIAIIIEKIIDKTKKE
jgi:hypothetical protein